MTSFLLASLIFAMTPGVATLYIFNNSLTRGSKSGILSALGVMVGGAIYNLLTSLGLASIIISFPFLFNAIKILGIIYLIYIGISGLIDKKGKIVVSVDPCAFKKGVLTNLANPKIMLFFITFLPQFVGVEEGNIGLKLFILGCIYLLIELTWFSSLALLTSKFTESIKRIFDDRITTISSITYILMGVALAIK